VSQRPLIVAVGEVGLEVIGVVPRLPDGEAPMELRECSLQIGGAAAIALGTAAAMGTGTRLACKLADDFIAAHVLDALAAHGIDTQARRASTAQLSGLALAVVVDAPTRRHSFFTRGDVEPLTADELDVDALLDGAAAVIVDGSCPAAQRVVAERAARRQIPVIVDAAQLSDGLGTLASLADVLICSERFASEIAPRDDLRHKLAELQRLGPRGVVITLGDAGSIGAIGDEVHEQACHPVAVVDRTGSGPVYLGAFVAALVGGMPFPGCMELASVAAALACRHIGGFAGIPARTEVVAAMRARG
jgi:sulfofructose kinase